MTRPSYTSNASGRIGSAESMAQHIAEHPTPREYRRGRFFAINRFDDDDGFYRDKAQRLARWHRQSRATDVPVE